MNGFLKYTRALIKSIYIIESGAIQLHKQKKNLLHYIKKNFIIVKNVLLIIVTM